LPDDLGHDFCRALSIDSKFGCAVAGLRPWQLAALASHLVRWRGALAMVDLVRRRTFIINHLARPPAGFLLPSIRHWKSK